MSTNIAFNAAVDIVDTFGPYPADWPAAQKPALEALERSSTAFADHLTEMRELEDQMSAWDEAADGVDVGETAEPAGGDDADSSPIEIDPGAITDMDTLLAKFIERALAEHGEEYRVFTKDLDALIDVPTKGATVDKIQLATAAAVGPLQKELTRLIAARTAATRLPGQRRGRIHAPNLHRVLSGDDRVFSRKQEAPALDTAITLLVDASGSMAGGAYSGSKIPWSSAPFVLAMQAAYALGSVLSRIGVPFEVIAYTTKQTGMLGADYMAEVEAAHQITPITRYTPLVYPRFKEFHEPFNLEVQRRFGAAHDTMGVVTMGGTIEGCSVEFAARRLLQQPQKRKLMIVLSDGKPAGPVYQGAGMTSAFGSGGAAYQRHAAAMVQEVMKSGIDLVGVGIKYAAIQNYYPSSIVIDNIAEMPAKLMGVLKTFLMK